MLVAIHQPNFLPWLGWFDKLARADVFILLDSVAHQHGCSNYTNRVQILAAGSPRWLTVPVTRGEAARHRIDQLRIAEDGVWRRKLRAGVSQSYARAGFFGETMGLVDAVLAEGGDRLCEMNIAGIEAIARALDLPCQRLVRASALDVTGRSTGLLVGLVQAAGGDAYLAGGGAAGYQDDMAFAAAGIRLYRQEYLHPVYRQLGDQFVPGLSAIDALMNCGPEAALLVGRSALRRSD